MYHPPGSWPQPTRRVLVGVLVGVLLILPACSQQPFPIVPIFDFHLSHVTSTFGRGGRAVAVDVDPADARVAIAGAEQGGSSERTTGGESGPIWTRCRSPTSSTLGSCRQMLAAGRSSSPEGWTPGYSTMAASGSARMAEQAGRTSRSPLTVQDPTQVRESASIRAAPTCSWEPTAAS
jgi:hypothetical protein